MIETKTTKQIIEENRKYFQGNTMTSNPDKVWVGLESLKKEIEFIRYNMAQAQLKGFDCENIRIVYLECNYLLDLCNSQEQKGISEVDASNITSQKDKKVSPSVSCEQNIGEELDASTTSKSSPVINPKLKDAKLIMKDEKVCVLETIETNPKKCTCRTKVFRIYGKCSRCGGEL